MSTNEPAPTTPPISADETFARLLHAWLNSRPRAYRPLQQAAEAWLIAKGR